MRYLSSRSFLAGLVLTVGAFVVLPSFVTVGERNCTGPSPESSSWDCYQQSTVNFGIPLLLAVSGVVMMLVAVRRRRLSGRE